MSTSAKPRSIPGCRRVRASSGRDAVGRDADGCRRADGVRLGATLEAAARTAAGQASGADTTVNGRAAPAAARYLAAQRPAGGRLCRPGRPVQTHALRVATEVCRARAGRTDG